MKKFLLYVKMLSFRVYNVLLRVNTLLFRVKSVLFHVNRLLFRMNGWIFRGHSKTKTAGKTVVRVIHQPPEGV
jgi:hypothetical protein